MSNPIHVPSYKVVIAGSRTITDKKLLDDAIHESGFDISEVISGTARGVDQLGEQWAQEHNIPIRKFPADWTKYGKSAGYRRNEEMIIYVYQNRGAVIALWDGSSLGTQHTIDLAKKYKIPIYIKTI